MTTKKISLEQFLSMTNLATLIPDWDAYEYGGNLFIDKENLIKMIYFMAIKKDDLRIIRLCRYEFNPDNLIEGNDYLPTVQTVEIELPILSLGE